VEEWLVNGVMLTYESAQTLPVDRILRIEEELANICLRVYLENVCVCL